MGLNDNKSQGPQQAQDGPKAAEPRFSDLHRQAAEAHAETAKAYVRDTQRLQEQIKSALERATTAEAAQQVAESGLAEAQADNTRLVDLLRRISGEQRSTNRVMEDAEKILAEKQGTPRGGQQGQGAQRPPSH